MKCCLKCNQTCYGKRPFKSHKLENRHQKARKKRVENFKHIRLNGKKVVKNERERRSSETQKCEEGSQLNGKTPLDTIQPQTMPQPQHSMAQSVFPNERAITTDNKDGNSKNQDICGGVDRDDNNNKNDTKNTNNAQKVLGNNSGNSSNSKAKTIDINDVNKVRIINGGNCSNNTDNADNAYINSDEPKQQQQAPLEVIDTNMFVYGDECGINLVEDSSLPHASLSVLSTSPSNERKLLSENAKQFLSNDGVPAQFLSNDGVPAVAAQSCSLSSSSSSSLDSSSLSSTASSTPVKFDVTSPFSSPGSKFFTGLPKVHSILSTLSGASYSPEKHLIVFVHGLE
eukprot:Awhi_evm1s4021